MTWTQQPPTAPGVYVYLDGGVSPLGETSWYEYEKLLHVWPDFVNTSMLRADHGGRTFAPDVALLDGFWFGPIPEPPEVKSP